MNQFSLMRSRKNAVLTAISTCLWVCSAANSQIQPPSPPVRAPVPPPSLLSQLDDLAAKYHVAFVVEGSPDDFSDPSDGSSQALPQSAGTQPQGLASELAVLCARYDLSWRRQSGVELLYRNYSSAKSLPGVSLAEASAAIRDIDKLTRSFASNLNPNFVKEPAYFSFFNSLNQDQVQHMRGDNSSDPVANQSADRIQALRSRFHRPPVESSDLVLGNVNGDTLLPISDLSTDQQATLRRIAAFIYLDQQAKSAHGLAAEIAGIVKDGTVFRWKTLHGVRVFGYELSVLDRDGNRVFVPLSDSGGIRKIGNDLLISKAAMREGKDPADSQSSAAVPVPSEGNAAGAADNTIQSVITGVMGGADTPIHVDDELTLKPAMLVGKLDRQGESVVRALCFVYGLRIHSAEGASSERSLSRPRARRPDDLSGLRDAVSAVIPAPFFRAMVAEAGSSPEKPLVTPSEAPTADSPGESAEVRLAASDVLKAMPKSLAPRLLAMRTAAVLRLMRTLVPKVDHSSTGTIPLSQASPAERIAFADVLLADYLNALGQFLSGPVPKLITDYGNARINCRLSTSQGKPGVLFVYYMPADSGGRYWKQMTLWAHAPLDDASH